MNKLPDLGYWFTGNVIEQLVNMYISGMAINDIAIILGMPVADVNNALDHVLPHLIDYTE